MRSRVLSLNNPENFRMEESARAKAYFSKQSFTRVSNKIISELKEISRNSGGKNVRLCLHERPQSTFHNMIILEHKGKYYRAHKHRTKHELFHIIEGSMAIFLFRENGSLADIVRLGRNADLVLRISKGTYHCIMPLSDMVIYHESNPGPYLAKDNSIFPAWAPDGKDRPGVIKFRRKLLAAMRQPELQKNSRVG